MSELSGHPEHHVGTKVIDTHGHMVGKVADVFYDDRTLEPRWVAINLGVLHRNQPLMPLEETYLSDDGHLVVPFTVDTIKHAPPAHGVPPTQSEASEVAHHYGMPDAEQN
jgi:hypothetical protein